MPTSTRTLDIHVNLEMHVVGNDDQLRAALERCVAEQGHPTVDPVQAAQAHIRARSREQLIELIVGSLQLEAQILRVLTPLTIDGALEVTTKP